MAHDEKKEIMKIIKELEYKEGIDLDDRDIIEEAEKRGITKEKAEEIISELIKENYLYRPYESKNIVRRKVWGDFCPWAEEGPL